MILNCEYAVNVFEVKGYSAGGVICVVFGTNVAIVWYTVYCYIHKLLSCTGHLQRMKLPLVFFLVEVGYDTDLLSLSDFQLPAVRKMQW